MSTRAFTLAPRSPTTACAGAALGSRVEGSDGQLTTASLTGEIPGSRRTAFERDLGAARVQAGRHEHGSVAPLARAARDRMALGAPGEPIRATWAAQGDEIEHARMGFAFAARDAGDPPREGSLPLGHNFGSVSHSRAVEPAAIALAMFEEGCINESLAAAQAAVAGASCTSPQARAVLERIARHAALAWRCLRCLLDPHRAQVDPALRERVARRRPPSPPISPIIADNAAALADHGRLSSRDRAAIMYRLFAEMIRPLAAQMLQGIDARSLA